MAVVEAQGSGLVFGTTGGKCRFMVYLQDFKEGEKIVEGLSVAIDGPSEPELEFEHQDNGDIEVTWRPFAPGQYVVSPKFNGTPIKDSPFKVKIVGEVNTHGQYTPQKKAVYTGWAARRKSQATQGSMD
ncbi:filamin-A [Folsomia candida]|uniref:Filamin-A n=1 Tax=Folsomia candida TaxID=158441 RepID=A0A226EI77_FOLCA|nr:filamin-A [Folsomia candida]OXA56754.1 Filamin-A [Folsomia candida]